MRLCQERRLLILVTRRVLAVGQAFSYTMGSLSHSLGIQQPKVNPYHSLMQCYVPVWMDLHVWPWGASG